MWQDWSKTRPGLILWLLANIYYRRSIKGSTRTSRGTRFIFDGDAKLPSDFDDFLQNEDNKSFLNLFIATRAEAIDLGSEVGCVLYIIKANTVIDCKDGEACHMLICTLMTIWLWKKQITGLFATSDILWSKQITWLVSKSGQQILMW